MEYFKNFKKDVKNNLGIIVDKRNKQYKELFNRLGGIEATINHLLGQLNEIPKYRALVARRIRQPAIQRKYELKKKETKKKEDNAEKYRVSLKEKKKETNYLK